MDQLHSTIFEKVLENEDSQLYKEYRETLSFSDDVEKLLKSLDNLSFLLFDFSFINTTAKEFSVNEQITIQDRNWARELISAVCMKLGEEITDIVKERPRIIHRYNNCPITSEYVLLSSVSDEYLANAALNTSDLKLKLGEKVKRDNAEWIDVFVFELYEQ